MLGPCFGSTAPRVTPPPPPPPPPPPLYLSLPPLASSRMPISARFVAPQGSQTKARMPMFTWRPRIMSAAPLRLLAHPSRASWPHKEKGTL
eukprot:6143232-Pyramimonas_sp.AAC.1